MVTSLCSASFSKGFENLLHWALAQMITHLELITSLRNKDLTQRSNLKFSVPESGGGEAWPWIFSLLCHSCPEGEQLSCILFLVLWRWCILFSFIGCYRVCSGILLTAVPPWPMTNSEWAKTISTLPFPTRLCSEHLPPHQPSGLKVLLTTLLPVAHDLPGEISITSDMQMTPPSWQKVKRN